MANKIQLAIVSPQKVVYTTEFDMLIVRSTDGELGILPRHLPLVAGLVPHAMRAIIDGNEQLIAVSGGFIEVQPAKITVLASAAELPIQIDIYRAQKAYERARKRIEAFRAKKADAKDIDCLLYTSTLRRPRRRARICSGKMSRRMRFLSRATR